MTFWKKKKKTAFNTETDSSLHQYKSWPISNRSFKLLTFVLLFVSCLACEVFNLVLNLFHKVPGEMSEVNSRGPGLNKDFTHETDIPVHSCTKVKVIKSDFRALTCKHYCQNYCVIPPPERPLPHRLGWPLVRYLIAQGHWVRAHLYANQNLEPWNERLSVWSLKATTWNPLIWCIFLIRAFK